MTKVQMDMAGDRFDILKKVAEASGTDVGVVASVILTLTMFQWEKTSKKKEQKK